MTVIPPKEIKGTQLFIILRDVIEKTANFIAKMGLETQERIRRDEAENPRFAFLKANDQYHAYYREKLKELGITIDTEYVKDVIYPPVELRLIIDKTAGFVVKNGAEFQERIRENEKGNPRFSFLNPMDPYHLYYTYKLQEISEGRVLLKPIEEDVLVQKNNKATNKQNAAPPEPEKFQFYFEHPPVDVIKLTALFVARNGRQFMTMVSQREAKNFQFDFLKPQHSLFPFFNALIEQYTKVLIPSKDMKDKLEKDANDKFNALDRIMGRLEYELYTEEQRKMEEEQRAREEEMYNQIDWNDFVIVQTIDFKEMDLHVDLPGPIDQATMKSLTMLQKKTVNETFPVANQENYQEEDEDMDMDMDMDDEEEAPVEEPKVIVPETMASVKIKTNYIPKAELLKHAKPSDQLQLCPVCNQMILSSELQEHMRIELLDPKWKEQRDRMLAKQGSTNYVQEGYDIGKHMEDFAKKRSDIFGKGEQPQEKEKINENVVQWDGHAASKSIAK
ncbi:Surp module, partial [Rozella allomycis CSF55]